MNEFTCPNCGALVSVTSTQTTMAGMPGITWVDSATCASCRRAFSSIQIDEIAEKQALGEVPCVNLLNAARMLGRPGDAVWVQKEFSGQLRYIGQIAYLPIQVIRAYAEANGIAITPLDVNIQPVLV